MKFFKFLILFSLITNSIFSQNWDIKSDYCLSKGKYHYSFVESNGNYFGINHIEKSNIVEIFIITDNFGCDNRVVVFEFNKIIKTFPVIESIGNNYFTIIPNTELINLLKINNTVIIQLISSCSREKYSFSLNGFYKSFKIIASI